MDKFKVGESLRARKYEEKIKSGNTDNLIREYWEKNKAMIGTIDMVWRERESYNRNEWGIESREVMRRGNESFEKDLINRERDFYRGNGKRKE